MAGNTVENIKITHEDIVQQLVKQLTTMQVDIAVVRAENDKLRQYIADNVVKSITE
jgi:hypothetical protein